MFSATAHRIKHRHLRSRVFRLGLRVEEGLKAAAQRIYDESQKLVPIDTDALKLSGIVRQRGHHYDAVMTVGYGIIGAVFTNMVHKKHDWSHGKVEDMRPWEYAVYVHQDVSKFHSPGQANFLGQPASDVQAVCRVFNAAARIP